MRSLKNFLVITLITLTVLLIVVFLCRNIILNSFVESKLEEYCESHKANVTYKSLYFSGLTSVTIEGLKVECVGLPPFLVADTIEVSARIGALLKASVSIEEVYTKHLVLNAIRTHDLDNFKNLLSSNADTTEVKERSYSERVNRLVKKLFRIIPNSLRCNDTQLKYQSDSLNVNIVSNKAVIIEGHMNSQFVIHEANRDNTYWTLFGMISKDEEIIDVKLIPGPGTAVPYLQNKLGLFSSFSSCSFALSDFDYSDDILSFHSSCSVDSLTVVNKRIAADTVEVPYAFADLYIRILNDGVVIDTNSTARLGKLKLKPYVELNSKRKSIDLSLKMNAPAQDFFDALPKGLFTNLEGIQAKGNLVYSGHVNFSKNKPDSVKFESELKGVDFAVTKYGNTDLRKMNGEFSYTAYDKSVPVRTFSVGPSNGNFMPLSQISSNLKNAVMTSEDGNFFGHKGFNQEAFRQSIAANYKAKRFVRGGSTISMQLIKNVFLNRNKTVARKLEEAIIVWMIENKRLTSKERMLEVYFNIIEWGPNVYGAQEASQFYFNKPASDININEAIYMAMIVPRPKGFMYNFEKDGKLKAYTNEYFQLMKRHMLRKSLVAESDSISSTLVNITGPALKYVLKVDSLPVDTIEQPEIFLPEE